MADLDRSQLSPVARKILDPASPPPLRLMAAKGVAPGLKPSEALTVVVILSEEGDDALRSAAASTLGNVPRPLLNGALAAGLHPYVIERIALRFASDLEVSEKLLRLPDIPIATVAAMAMSASEPVSELIATNEERLLAHPEIIEKLYMNSNTRMSTADRIVELAIRNGLELRGIPAFREIATALAQNEARAKSAEHDAHYREVEALSLETPLDPTQEDTHYFDEASGEEVVQKKVAMLESKLATMTVTEKIRRAQLGTAAERLVLVRDKNRQVAESAVKSPKIQENEIIRITASRSVSDGVLRIIADDQKWTRSHQVKLNLVQNPRTPLVKSSQLISHLREHELRALAKSKNVTGAIATAARRQLERKGK